MTPSILLFVKRPDEQDQKAMSEYNSINRTWEGIATRNTDTELLAEGAIRIELSNGLQGVADAVCSIQKMPYTYAILTEDLQLYSEIKKT